jgi:Ca2+-binding RTX toxin-like protein
LDWLARRNGDCGAAREPSVRPDRIDRAGNLFDRYSELSREASMTRKSQKDIFTGTDDDDIFRGTPQDSVIHGNGGNDTLTGARGDDKIFGDDGDDVLRGGEGDDRIWDGAGDDQLFGGAGDDVIYIISGNDIANGGAGDDIIYLDGNLADWTYIQGGEGGEPFVFERGDQTVAFDNFELAGFDDGVRDLEWPDPELHTNGQD